MYNVVLVSGIQSDLYIYIIYVFFSYYCPFDFLHDIEYRSLCNTIGHCL